jgi:hypothetical protein
VCLIKYYATKTWQQAEVELHSLLTLTLD